MTSFSGKSISFAKYLFGIPALIVVFLSGVSVALVLNRSAPTWVGPRMIISTRLLNFGALPDGHAATKEVTIRNDGFQTLNIDSVVASCGCTSATVEKTSLAWREETKLRVTVTGRPTPIEARVAIASNDPRTSRQTIGVIAMTDVRVLLSATHLEFAPESPASLPITKQLFLNFPDRTLFSQTEVVAASIDSPHFRTVVRRDRESATCSIAVTVLQSAPTGTTRAILRLSDAHGQFMFKLPITVDCPSKYWLHANPVVLRRAGLLNAPVTSDVPIKLRDLKNAPGNLGVAVEERLKDVVRSQVIHSDVEGCVLLRFWVRAAANKPLLNSVQSGHALLSVQPDGSGKRESFSIPILLIDSVQEHQATSAVSQF